MIITHGDADHFDGLNDIVRSEKLAAAPQKSWSTRPAEWSQLAVVSSVSRFYDGMLVALVSDG